MTEKKRNVKVLIDNQGDFTTFTIIDFCTNETIENDSIQTGKMSRQDIRSWILDGKAAAVRIAAGGSIIYGGRHARKH